MTKGKWKSCAFGSIALLLVIAIWSPPGLRPGPMRFAALACVAACVPLAVLCLSKPSRKKQTLWYALAIFAICVPLLGASVDARQLLNAMSRFAPVMSLLAGVSLFRHSLMRSGLAAAVSSRLIQRPARKSNSLRVALASIVLTLFTSLGAISVMGTVCAAQVKNRLGIARIAMRSLCASMFILPTTVASASIAAAIPHLDTGAVLLYGMPLTLLMMAGATLPRLDVAERASGSTDAPASARHRTVPFVFAAVVAASGALFYVATRRLTWSFTFAMLFGYVLELSMPSRGRGARAIADEVAASLDAIAPELMLLAASGLLIFTIAHLDVVAHLPSAMRASLHEPFAIGVLLVVVLPAITMLGIHPMILFGLFFPLVDAAALGPGFMQYLAWTAMFTMANLLSPVSICAILAATSLGVSSRETSYVSNWKFCGVGMTVIYVYLLSLSRFFA